MAVPAVPPYHLSGRPAQQAVDLPDVLVLSSPADPRQPAQQAVDLPDVLVLSGPADRHQPAQQAVDLPEVLVLSGPAQPAQRRIQGRQQINILSGTSPQAVQKQVGKMRKYCFYFFVGADENSTMLRKIISGFLQIL